MGAIYLFMLCVLLLVVTVSKIATVENFEATFTKQKIKVVLQSKTQGGGP